MAETPKHQPDQYAQPTPEQQQVPYEQQPAQQQYFAQPNAAPVQYVIAQQSLKGLRGWLLFFTIIAGLYALGTIGIFVESVANFTSTQIADVILTPFLFASAVAAIVLTALEKKIARFIFIGMFVLAYLYGIVTNAVTGVQASELVSGILVGGLMVGLISLYFMTSKRVKETLVK